MKILVTGRKGQVARSLADLNRNEAEIITLGRPELNIANMTSIERALDEICPDVVVNAAAYTSVDKAESEPAWVFLVNRDGAANVAQAAHDRNLPIIHISTDYVFNGEQTHPYKETDAPGPLNVYGLSKLQGEWAVIKANPQHVILRTAWVYSAYGNNFVKTMLRLANTQDKISVVADQWGTPTSAAFIAEAILHIARQLLEHQMLEKDALYGIFHLVPDGHTNWANFAETISQMAKHHGAKNFSVTPIASSDYKTVAHRGRNLSLDNNKLKQHYNLPATQWQTVLESQIAFILSAII